MNSKDRSDLIKRISDIEGLTDKERSALLGLLRENKTYGLVWEDKPEDIEERLRDELPILTEVPERAIISEDKEAPNHILIEGDNLEALATLAYTHEGKVDVIYIDPPYNTGNKDFIYNDQYVDKEDSYRHSKWLSFMSRRLKIAKRLLSDKGVIFISIDDNELAQLKLLCDEVFGIDNFISQMIWQQGKKSSGNLIGINHEYMLVYAKNRFMIDRPSFAWMQKKGGLDKIYNKYNNLLRLHGDDTKKIEEEIKKWFNSLAENDPAYSSKHYSLVDNKGLFFADNSCAPDRPESRSHKPLIHPITKKETAVPSLGWRWKEETLDKMVKDGMIYYGKDENVVPKVKKYLKDMEYELPTSVFYRDGRGASIELDTMLGRKLFNNPKDRNELQRILNWGNWKTILDFFAGSGTTLHATMQLNAEDGGNRKCILVTNNENNICEEVTYERNKRVINGYTTPKGEEVAGLKSNNLRYYRTGFVGRSRSMTNMRKLVNLSTDMLCIKEDLYTEQPVFGEQKTQKGIFRYFDNGSKQMLIIYREEAIDELVELIYEMDINTPIKVYVFSPSEDPWEGSFEEVSDKVELCALPQAIYNTYRRILPKKRDAIILPEDDALAQNDNETTHDGMLNFTEEGEEA